MTVVMHSAVRLEDEKRLIAPPRIARITHAQAKVLQELCRDGASDHDISRRLYITIHTAKSHMKHLFQITGCTNRTELAVAVLRGTIRVQVVTRRDETVRP